MSFVSLEKVIRRAPLGVRFIDMVRNVPVEDGLRVTVWPLGQPMLAQRAERSPVSGTYGVRTLPGMRAYESGDAPATEWCAGVDESGEANFALHIEDTWGRFLPQARRLCLPKETLLQLELVSSPSRPRVAGFILVVGEVWDQEIDGPAGWALVGTSDEQYVTIADNRGMFALYVPLPAPPANGIGASSLGDLTWDLSFRVRYHPDHQVTITGAAAPDTASIVEQPFATLYNTFVEGDATATQTTSSILRQFKLGGDLVLRTEGEGITRLLLQPAP